MLTRNTVIIRIILILKGVIAMHTRHNFPPPRPHTFRRAFTLIELLIVVAIIAILAAIAVPNFLEAQTRAKVARARADMRSEATALETYRIDWNKYPRPFDHHQGGKYYTRADWHEHIPSTLSTPVSYLPSIPDNDPFLPRVPETRPILKDVEGRHFFFNAPFSLKAIEEDRGIVNYGEYVEYRRIGGDYAIFSYGPDRLYYNQPDGPSGVAYTEWQFIDYDPSNGTISPGNIIRSQKNGDQFGADPYIYRRAR